MSDRAWTYVYDGEDTEKWDNTDFAKVYEPLPAPRVQAPAGTGEPWPWYAQMLVFMMAARLSDLPIVVGGARELSDPESGDYWTVRHFAEGDSDDEDAEGVSMIEVRLEPAERIRGAIESRENKLKTRRGELIRSIAQLQKLEGRSEDAFAGRRTDRLEQERGELRIIDAQLSEYETQKSALPEGRRKLLTLASVQGGTAELSW